jgi:hypothetical protein
VVAEAHDVEAELALTALGGGRCPCVDVVTACRAGLDVEDLFLLWTEAAEPSVGTAQALERWARRVGRPLRAGGTPTARLAEERRSALLASLPAGFRRRLALGVFRAIAREAAAGHSTSHPGFEPIFASVLHEALQAAGLTPARRWRLAAAGEPASAGTVGRSLLLVLSPGWVVDVWAWGLAVVDGHFVLDVITRRSACEVTVRALVVDAAGCVSTRAVEVRRTGPAWRTVT